MSEQHQFGKGQKLFDKADKYISENKYDKAKNMIEEALKIFKELNTQLMVSQGYIKQGIIYEVEGNWKKALKKYEKSLEIREKMAIKTPTSSTTKRATITPMVRYQE